MTILKTKPTAAALVAAAEAPTALVKTAFFERTEDEDMNDLLQLNNATDEQLNEAQIDDEEFLKLEEGQEICGTITGLKEMKNNFFKADKPLDAHNTPTRTHVRLSVLSFDETGAPIKKRYLCNAVMLVNYAKNIFSENTDVLKVAVKIVVKGKIQGDNGSYLNLSFYTLSF